MDFKKTSWCNENESVLHCPVCGFEYVHLVGSEPTTSEHPGLILSFECEEGHSFTSRLHNHKGYMVSEIEVTVPAEKA